MKTHEVNFDGLVGPTHNYAGLAFGNVAASNHEGQTSSPKQAALQGLEKMWALHQLGLPQAVLPPHERPFLPALCRLGFNGDDEAALLAQVQRQAPHILAAVSSASAMWVANAATVSPFPDTEDGKTHITPANLCSMFHRAIEVDVTARLLKTIFTGDDYRHHPPLPSGPHFSDEGAANHTRFCGGGNEGGSDEPAANHSKGESGEDSDSGYGAPGVELFVYGISATAPNSAPKKFPARQTLQASEAIARTHRLHPAATVFARQNPAAIDAGVFHNDVIAVGNRDVLLYHQQAFDDTESMRAQLTAACTSKANRTHSNDARDRNDNARGSEDGARGSEDSTRGSKDSTRGSEDSPPIHLIEVPAKAVSLTDAVASYLFNSQLICLPGDSTGTLIAPRECEEITSVHRYLEETVAAHPRIAGVIYRDLRQSMNNGGGPACLRLRVVMSEAQIAAVPPRVILDEPLYTDLRNWVEQHYRDRLTPADLSDPALLHESRTALDALTRILNLGPLYDFQRD